MEKLCFIMLPGWGMSSCVWQPLEKELSKNYLLKYCTWDKVNSIQDFKLSVLKLIEEEGDILFSIIGWSLGSMVAIDVAHEYQERIKHLILIGGTSRFTRDRSSSYNFGWPQQVLEKMKSNLVIDKEKTLLAFYESMFSAEEKIKGYQDLFTKISTEFCHKTEIADLVGLDYLIQMDFREKLKDIELPTLLIHGEEDKICPVSASEYISSRLVGYVSLKKLKGVGHVPFLTNTIGTLTHIQQFVEKGVSND